MINHQAERVEEGRSVLEREVQSHLYYCFAKYIRRLSMEKPFVDTRIICLLGSTSHSLPPTNSDTTKQKLPPQKRGNYN